MGGTMPDFSVPGHYALGLAAVEPEVTQQTVSFSACPTVILEDVRKETEGVSVKLQLSLQSNGTLDLDMSDHGLGTHLQVIFIPCSNLVVIMAFFFIEAKLKSEL